MRLKTGLLIGILTMMGTLALAPSASAAHHLVKIREVFPGSTANGTGSEYVVLQLTSAGENATSGSTVRLYNSMGVETNSVALPASVPNGQNQRSIFVATADAAMDFSLTANATLPAANALDPLGGGACFTSTTFGNLDCVTWGSLSGAGMPSPSGGAAPPIPDEGAIKRDIDLGCPSLHEFADDTNNSANDFSIDNPAPRNNASTILEAPCVSLTINFAGDGTGDVTGTIIPANIPVNCTATCTISNIPGAPAQSVNLLATPTPGHDLTGFGSCDTQVGTSDCGLLLTTNKTVTATFDNPSTTPPPPPPAPITITPVITTPITTTPPAAKKCPKGKKLKRGKCVKKKKKK